MPLPRAWILFEVAVWPLNNSHSGFLTDDMAPFALHVEEVVRGDGMVPTLEKHGHRCTNSSDLRLVTVWLEILVILHKIVPDVHVRQEAMDVLSGRVPLSFGDRPKRLESCQFLTGFGAHNIYACQGFPVLTRIYSPSVGSYSNPVLGLSVDQSAGTITLNGTVHQFTPVFSLNLE